MSGFPPILCGAEDLCQFYGGREWLRRDSGIVCVIDVQRRRVCVFILSPNYPDSKRSRIQQYKQPPNGTTLQRYNRTMELVRNGTRVQWHIGAKVQWHTVPCTIVHLHHRTIVSLFFCVFASIFNILF